MLETPKRIVKAAMADNITGEAAKATYYLFFSIFPLLIAAFALTGLLGGERAFVWIMGRLETLAPGEGADILEGFVAGITQQERFDALSIGMLLALWAGSNFFAALGEGLDTMFNVREDAGFLKRRGKALLMLFFGGALLVAGAAAIIAGPQLTEAAGIGYVGSLLRWPLGFLLVSAVFFLMYYILPNRDQSDIRRDVAIGALVGAALWLAATGGFSFYVQNFGQYDQTYGPFAAIIIFMLWLFISAVAILFGGEVAHVLSERGGAARADEAGDGEPASDDRAPGRGEGADDRARGTNGRERSGVSARLRGNGQGDGRERARGTSLAPGRAVESDTRHYGRRRHPMAVDRNEGFGTGEFGAGDPRGGTHGRSEELRDKAESLRERGEEALEHGRERAGAVAESGRNRVADKLEQFGDRLEERGRETEGSGGIQQRAGRVAVRAGNKLDDSADYIRSHDFHDMRDDLERQIREKPLMSMGIALGAGFLLARILRD